MDVPLEEIHKRDRTLELSATIGCRNKQEERRGDPSYVRRRSGVEDAEPLLKSHPEPTDDPLDPLNFSRLEKWTCLGIVMYLWVSC